MAHEPEELKRDAAVRALDEVSSGMVLGLGTGSTVNHFLQALGSAVEEGRFTDLVGVPTSQATERRAVLAGIVTSGLSRHPRVDLTVDGADEVAPDLSLIKGRGGALLREKMVAQASRRLVIVADDRKAVERLGTRSPLPVEVVGFAWEAHVPFLESLGCRVTLRCAEAGAPYRTDNGNLVLDCRFSDGIPDAEQIDNVLRGRAGVVETGLFLRMADRVVLASRNGVRVLDRNSEATPS